MRVKVDGSKGQGEDKKVRGTKGKRVFDRDSELKWHVKLMR